MRLAASLVASNSPLPFSRQHERAFSRGSFTFLRRRTRHVERSVVWIVISLAVSSGVIKIVLPSYYNLKLPVRWERFVHSFGGYLHKYNFLVYFDEMEPV